MLSVRRADRPGCRSLDRVARRVRPLEGRPTPGLNVDAQMFLVPLAQRLGIFRAEEDAADACDSSHFKPPIWLSCCRFIRIPFCSCGTQRSQLHARSRLDGLTRSGRGLAYSALNTTKRARKL